MFRVSCCTFNVPGFSLEESLSLIHQTGFTTADVGAKGLAGELKQSLAAGDPFGYANQVAAAAARYALKLDELFVCTLIIDDQEVPITTPDPELRARMLDHFARLCRFAAAAGFQSIMIATDKAPDGMGEDQAWQLSVEMLSHMVNLAKKVGLVFNIEPTPFSLLTSPQKALQMAEDVPGLRFTLDYSHYIAAGFAQEEIEPLHRYLSHLHMRQAKPGQSQCYYDEGAIALPRLLQLLLNEDYSGNVAVEYIAARKNLCDG